MKRALCIVASAFVLFCAPARAAAPEPVPAEPIRPAGDAVCDAEPDEGLVLDDEQQRHCRALRQSRIEETRQRNREHIRHVIEENRLRREREASLPPPPPPRVTVESFIGTSSLSYGDVVVTDRGPQVFIGKPGEAVTPKDFVAVDSQRSPHRARATQFDGAFPQRRALPPHKEPPPPARRERQP